MIKKKTIEAISQELRVSPGAVYAIVHTESNGAFSWGNGQIPILFERHICYRELKKEIGLLAARKVAKQHPDICNPKSGGYGKSSNQYNRLAKAIKVVGDDIAHLSTSFGAFQLMGFNHKMAGYWSAKTMSDAFHEKPKDAQVQGFMNFISNYKNGRVLTALRNRNWQEAARLYNGSKYYINSYDKKMKTANHAYNSGAVDLA